MNEGVWSLSSSFQPTFVHSGTLNIWESEGLEFFVGKASEWIE